MTDLPYNSYSRHLKSIYGTRVYRVAVDAGFSCPNRASRESPGCSYCAEDGGRAPYLQDVPGLYQDVRFPIGDAMGVAAQIERTLRFLRRRYEAESFILYFQAFTGTGAKPAELKRIYDSALAVAPFRELVVSTRPDCIDDEKAELLGSYKERGLGVWVELGLQTARNETLAAIGRGHTVEDFAAAYATLRKHGLSIAVHLILGLPGETASDMEATARYVAGCDPDGVKLHNLHIPAAAPLAAELRKGEISAPGPASHLEYVISTLELLPPRCLVMRLSTDTPKSRLLSPRGFGDKQGFTARIIEEMGKRGTFQGRLYSRGVSGNP